MAMQSLDACDVEYVLAFTLAAVRLCAEDAKSPTVLEFVAYAASTVLSDLPQETASRPVHGYVRRLDSIQIVPVSESSRSGLKLRFPVRVTLLDVYLELNQRTDTKRRQAGKEWRRRNG